MFGRKEPTSEIDQRAARLAGEREAHAAVVTERAGLEDARNQAVAARKRAHNELAKVLNDPDRYADATDDDIAAAKKTYQLAREAEAKVMAELAAHQKKYGDLAARGNQLRQEEALLSQECLRAADREDVTLLVRLGAELASVEARMDRRRRDAAQRWPKDEALTDGRTIAKAAGLADIGFPPGIFDVMPTPLGPRSVWRDCVLVGVHLSHPSIELPAGDAAAVAERAARKPRWYAGAPGWDVDPIRRF